MKSASAPVTTTIHPPRAISNKRPCKRISAAPGAAGLPADVGTAADWLIVRLLSGHGNASLLVPEYHAPILKALRRALRVLIVRFPEMIRRTDQFGSASLLGSQANDDTSSIGECHPSCYHRPATQRRPLEVEEQEDATKEALNCGALTQLHSNPGG